MDKILYAGAALGVLALVVTIFLCLRNRYEGDGLLCVKETWMTAVMGLMMIALGVYFTYLKLTDAAVAGTDANSYWFVAAFSLVCHLMGDFCLLFTFIKRVVVHDDRLEAVSFLGKSKSMNWTEVVKVERPMMQKAYKLRDKNGNIITVSGLDKDLREFETLAKDKIQNTAGADLLRRVENRLRLK